MKEDVTAAMIYYRENKHIFHKHYTEIAKERMHSGNHHLIVKHKALLPTSEDKMMTTVSRPLMLEWMRTKRSEKYVSFGSVM